MSKNFSKSAGSRVADRTRRKSRVRRKIVGTDARPRLCVFRSLRYTYVQLISDETASTLCSLTTREFCAKEKSASSVESAKVLGKKVAEVAKEKKIEKVVFDRNGYLYHGRVAAVAEGAREEGLLF